VPYRTSTDALFSDALPEHLVVLGGGYVACELAQAFRRMGSEVTMLVRSTLLSEQDPALGAGLQAAFEAEGIRVLVRTQASQVAHDNLQFRLETNQGEVRADRLLVATGRRANTNSLSLAAAGVETDRHGSIVVDECLRTSVPHILSLPLGIARPHLSSSTLPPPRAGHAAVNMLGGNERLDLSVLPAVVFTDPAVATVGLDERRAKEQGLVVDSRTLDLENVPRALANFDIRGFIKLVAEKETGRLVGAQILAHDGGEVVQTAALAIAQRFTVHDVSNMFFPYLTMAEGIKLCALTFTKDVKKLSCCAG
jgi:mercuric reductase